MKVQYIDTTPAGYGRLVFSEAMFPDAPWSVAILRASDQKYLTGSSQSPWAGEICFIPLDGQATTSGTLELEAGPDIVNNLDQQEQYAVILKGADDVPQKGRLRISAITYSRDDELHNTARMGQIQSAKPLSEKPEQAVGDNPPVYSGAIELPQPERHENKPHKWWRYGLIALLAVGCVAWYILDPRKDSSIDSPSSRPEIRKGEGNGAKIPDKATAQGSADSEVKNFFGSGQMTPQGAAELAQRLPKTTPSDQDAVYRLYYYAAENNYAPVLMTYAACFDPSGPAWGTIQKNALEAWQIYEKAKAYNPQEADAAQKKLLAWLEEEAGKGNSQAKTWLAQLNR